MKSILYAILLTFFITFSQAPLAKPGDIDSGFGLSGVTVTSIDQGHDDVNALAVLPDGTFFAAGRTRRFDAGISTDLDFALVKYLNSGLVDTSFGINGIITTNLGGDETANAIAVLSDGSILMAGRGSGAYLIVKYSANGTLDTSFASGNGYLYVDPTTGNDSCYSIAISPSGKIVLTGNADYGSHFEIVVIQLNSNGTIDTTFGGGDGIVILNPESGSSDGRSVAVQPDGKILVAGDSSTGSTATTNIVLLRFNQDGSLDTTFDTDGIAITDIGGFGNFGRALVIQPDGKILVAGEAFISGTGYDFSLARYNTDGSLDTTFSSDGVTSTPVLSGIDKARAIALQPDGKILIAGFAENSSNNYNDDFALVRYNNDGLLDTTFGNSGITTTTIGGDGWEIETGYALSIQPDGKILLAESNDLSDAVDRTREIVIARYLANDIDNDYLTDEPWDITPSAFIFNDISNAGLSSVQTSENITITGLGTDVYVPVRIQGGEYSINSGSYTSNLGYIKNNDIINVRHTSSAITNTATNTLIDIGGLHPQNNTTLTIGSTYSDTFTSTTANDLTPDTFSFIDQTGVTISSSITSNSVTVTGITGPVDISVSGGTYSINSGAYTSTAGTVVNGDTVTVRHTSAATASTPVDTTLTIGGISDTFTSTTADDITPNAFTFTDVSDVAHSTLMTSNSITVAGITAATAISVSGGTYSVNGGAYTSTAGTVVNGDSITVRHTSASTDATTVNTTLTIGGISDTYTSTTSDLTPNAFTFTDVSDVAHSTQMTSNSITVAGITAATAISVSGGTYSVNGGAYTSTAGTVVNGDSITVRHTSASTDATAVNTTLTIGGISDTYTSTTSDLTPNAFTFTDVSNVAHSTQMTSNSITVAGITAATAISVSGGTYSVNGGAYTSNAGTLANGDTVTVQHTSASADATAVNTTLTIGGISDTYTSTTSDLTPNAFTFTDVSNVAHSTQMTSNSITVSGITAATAISVSGGTYSVNGGAYTSNAGTLANGDTVTVQHTSASADATAVNTTLTIGGISDTYTSTTSDLTPNAFTFTDIGNAAHSTLMTSNSITVAGITAATAISVSGGTYSVNGGAYTSNAGTLANGDTVTVQHTSASADATAVNTTLTIGGISDTYTSTTSDLTPNAFTFTDIGNAAHSTLMTSNSITVAGITAATAISVSGGTYSVNGGAYTSTAGTVVNGDSITVRHTSASTDATAVNTTLTIGGISDTYTSTTSDLTPNAFTFTDVSNVAHSTQMTSNSITVSGITAATAISVSGGTYSIDGGNTYTSVPGSISNGTSVTVRHTSASTDATAVNTTLTIGGISDTYTSTTSGLTPNAFTFTDVSNVAHSTLMTSNSITVAGITTATTISVSGGTYSVNGGAYTSTAGTVVNGDSITVRHTSASSDATAVNTTLTIGGISDTYTSTTSDLTPNAISFTDLTGVATSIQITSNSITVAGITAPTAISVSGGSYSVNGGAYTSTAGTVVNGDSITVRHTSAATASTQVDTTLTIGGVSDTFTSTTADDVTPNAFTFTDVTGVATSIQITSNSITVDGITAATAISVSGGTYSVNGGAYTSTAGTVVNGDSITVRHTSAATASTQVDTMLTIGGVSDTFTSTTSNQSSSTNSGGGGGGSIDIYLLLLASLSILTVRRRHVTL